MQPKINVLTDGGSENTIIRTDADLNEVAQQVIAQVDVVQSNSLIERLWSQLRHRWLYLPQLNSFAGLERLVAAYFHDHNTRMPAMVLGGRTPDEATRPSSGTSWTYLDASVNCTETRNGNGS